MKKSKVLAALFAAAVMSVSAVPTGAYAESTSVTVEAQAQSAKEDISKCKVNLSDSTSGGRPTTFITYSGTEVKPEVSVKKEIGCYWGSAILYQSLEEGKDYTVTYKINKSIGTGTVVIKGIGEYTGTKKIKFDIVPANPDTPKVTSKNGKITISWNKVNEATKYRIYYSVNGGAYKKLADTAKCSYSTTKLKTENVTYKFSIASIAKVKNRSYINKSYVNNGIGSKPAIIQNGSFEEFDNVKVTAERDNTKDKKTTSITITGIDFDSYAKKVKGSKPWRIKIRLYAPYELWSLDYTRDDINIVVDRNGISGCSYAGDYEEWNLDHTYDPKTKTLKLNVKNCEVYDSFFNGLNGNFTNMSVTIMKPKTANSDTYVSYCSVGSFKATEGYGYMGYSKMTIDWSKAES